MLLIGWVICLRLTLHSSVWRPARPIELSDRPQTGDVRQYEGTQLFSSISGAMAL